MPESRETREWGPRADGYWCCVCGAWWTSGNAMNVCPVSDRQMRRVGARGLMHFWARGTSGRAMRVWADSARWRAAAPDRDAYEPDARLIGVDAGEIIQPHAEGGWPEFTMTLRFCATSDDPEVVADVQRRVLERDWWDCDSWTGDDASIKITLSPGEWGAIIDAARAGMPDVEPALKDDTYAAIEKLADLGGWT